MAVYPFRGGVNIFFSFAVCFAAHGAKFLLPRAATRAEVWARSRFPGRAFSFCGIFPPMSSPEFRVNFQPPGPVAERFMRSDKRVQIIMGPLGSGKTTALVVKIMHLMVTMPLCIDGVRRSRWVAIRNTYSELFTTTIKEWEEIFGKVGPVKKGKPPTATLDFIAPDGTRVLSEIIFLALDYEDDVRKLRSLQATAGWVNEAKELPFQVVKMLQGRCGRYPPKQQLEAGWNYWWGILGDTNAPSEANWVHRVTELEPPNGWETFKQPGGVVKDEEGRWVENPQAENRVNLQPDYYADMVEGGEDSWIAVNLGNEYGVVRAGMPVWGEYSDVAHVARSAVDADRNEILHIGLDFGLCFSDDTEVLTADGWKFFKDVDADVDRAATLDPNGFGMSYTKINFKTAEHYKGDMLEFKGQNFDFCVTPEHRTPFTERDRPDELIFTSAEALSRRERAHRYIQTAGRGWSGKAYSLCGLPEDLSMEFLGWYLSEGSCQLHGKASYRINISQKKPAPALEAMLARSEWADIGMTWHRGDGVFRGSHRGLGEAVIGLGKAKEKFVPAAALGATAGGLRVFLDAFIAGDGHIRSKAVKNSGLGRRARDEVTAFTTSVRLRDDLMEIAAKLGMTPCARRVRPQVSFMRSEGRRIFSSGGWALSFKKIERAEILPHHIRRVKYDGMIYCLNVPHHTLYVRRGGRPCWNGNTPAAVFVQRGRDTKVRVVDELTANMGAKRFAETVLGPHLRGKYSGFRLVITGDPAGDHRAETDESTVFQVLASCGIVARPAPTNDVEIRIEAVAGELRRMVEGSPAFVVSPVCKVLREAMAGGYCYKKITQKMSVGQYGQRWKDRPEKNAYSHISDALQYAMLGMGAGRSVIRSAVGGDFVQGAKIIDTSTSVFDL